MSEEDGDVNEHEEVAGSNGVYVGLALPVYLIHNGSLEGGKEQVAREGQGENLVRKE